MPVSWAWTSTSLDFRLPNSFVLHEDVESQIALIASILTDIAWILHQDWICWNSALSSAHIYGSGDDSGRPIIPRSTPSLWRSFPKEIQDRYVIRWSQTEWPGAEFQCIGHDVHKFWQAGRFVANDGQIFSSPRGFAQRDEFGSILSVFCSMWPWKLDATDIGAFSNLESSESKQGRPPCHSDRPCSRSL